MYEIVIIQKVVKQNKKKEKYKNNKESLNFLQRCFGLMFWNWYKNMSKEYKQKLKEYGISCCKPRKMVLWKFTFCFI